MQTIEVVDVTGVWQDRALCRKVDGDMFFGSGSAVEHEAKDVCKSCPVRWECLAYALRHRVEHGVWGGLTDRERRRVLNRTHASSWDPVAAMRVAAPAAS